MGLIIAVHEISKSWWIDPHPEVLERRKRGENGSKAMLFPEFVFEHMSYYGYSKERLMELAGKKRLNSFEVFVVLHGGSVPAQAKTEEECINDAYWYLQSLAGSKFSAPPQSLWVGLSGEYDVSKHQREGLHHFLVDYVFCAK